MEREELHRNSYLLPVPNGSSLPPQLFKLAAQSVPIRTVSINNSSTITVLVYQGPATNTVPVTILPKKSVTLAVAGPFSVYVAFNGVATTDGFVYLSFSNRVADMFAAEGTT